MHDISGKGLKARPEPESSARLSLSLPAGLFQQLDMMVEERELSSRSLLVTGLIRRALAEHEALAKSGEILAATITLVCRGDRSRVRQQIAQTQADFAGEVISSQHVFLDDDQFLEALLVQGSAARLKGLSDALRRVRGVHQLRLVATPSRLQPFRRQQQGLHRPNDEAA